MKTKIYLLIFFQVCFISQILTAQWQPTNGPYGGFVVAYASNENVIYAGTQYGGVYKSTNNGANWTVCNNGLKELNVGALYLDGDNIYAGTGVNGFYKSSNGGLSWETFPSEWTSYSVSAIAANGNDIYLGSYGGGLIVSHDGGISWDQSANGIYASETHTIMDILLDGDKIYLIDNGNLYKSTDNASSWTLMTQSVMSILKSGNSLFITNINGVFKSTDNGVNWLSSNTGLPNAPYGIGITAAGSYLYAVAAYYEGMYFSNNDGASWSLMNLPTENNIISFYSLADEKLLIQTSFTASNLVSGDEATLYLTADNGSNWENITNEITSTYCLSMATKDDKLFVGTFGTGIYSTTNQGLLWDNKELFDHHIRTLHVAGDILFAGSGWGINRSLDNGATWINSNQGLSNSSIQGFAHIDNNIFAATAGGVYISTDGGATWSQSNNNIATESILNILAVGTSLYAGTSNGIYMSTNYANSWVNISSNLPTNPVISDIEFINGHLAIVVNYSTVYMSADNGATWNNSNSTGIVHSLYAVGNMLFASLQSNYDVTQIGIIMSNDLGSTWQVVNEGLANNMVLDIAHDSEYLYVSTLGSGVFKRPLSEFQAVSASNELSSEFSLYPNPTFGQITIEIAKRDLGNICNVMNALGEVVLSMGKLSSTKLQIDCSDLPSGIYFVKIGNSLKRVIVD
jgi:photosystem II stability/assembly factor-like uncharacterized protein